MTNDPHSLINSLTRSETDASASVAGVSAASEPLELPPLPVPMTIITGDDVGRRAFGAQQMFDYAQSRIASLTADLAEARAKVEHLQKLIREANAANLRSECLPPLKAAATEPRVPLTDERIDELNREAQDQGISGIAPSRYLARAIELAHGISTTPGDDAKAVGVEVQS